MSVNLAPGLFRTDYAGPNGNIAIGDYNGDGRPDLASSNWIGVLGADSTVSLWISDAGGVFTKTATFASHSAQDLQFADLNGDQRLDLVVAQTYANSLGVFLATSAGGFAPRTNLGVGNVAVALEVADLDGDNKLDLVSTSYTGDQVFVWFGRGNGTFSRPTTYNVGDIPYGLAVADVTGDGRLDIITANAGDNSISILAGGPKGVFTQYATLQTGIGPLFLTVADLGNGRNSIIATNRDSDSVMVFAGNGVGSFVSTSYAVGDGPYGVTTGDLNGDGKKDVIVANGASETISVLLGNGEGALQAARNYGSFAGASTVVAGDLNGDGRDDFVVGSGTAMSVVYSTAFLGGLALDSSTDSGTLGDGKTTFNVVTITGSIDAGSTVRLYEGTTVVGIGIADAAGRFSITTSQLADGIHAIHAEATDGQGKVSLPSAPLAISVDTSVPGMPAGLSLDPSTDSAMPGDNITNVARVRVNGAAEAGALITLYEGATPIGTGVVDANGAFAITINAPLADGVHNIIAVASDLAGNMGAFSDPLSLTVDTTPGTATFIQGDIDQTGTTKKYELSGIVSDDTTNVVLVRFYLDGALLDEVTPVNGTWAINEPNIVDAVHLLTTETIDAAGNVGSGDRGFIGSSRNDTIVGTALGEIIAGMEGVDRLTGGGGSDSFNFGDNLFAPMPSGKKPVVETVTDFVQGEDTIHLAGMADFQYGGQSFLVTPFHINWFQNGGNTYITGDFSGDTTGDFMVQLLGLYNLSATDFIL